MKTMTLRALTGATFLILAASPSLAWEANSGVICELAHSADEADVLVTYDPAALEYSISFTLAQPWAQAPTFALGFRGPQANIISTNRHVLSQDEATLTVSDSGFGNVLNGLEFNQTMTAVLGEQAVNVPLEGASEAVQAFRRCASSVSI